MFMHLLNLQWYCLRKRKTSFIKLFPFKELSFADFSVDKNKTTDVLSRTILLINCRSVTQRKVNEAIGAESLFTWTLKGYYDCISSANDFNVTPTLRFNSEIYESKNDYYKTMNSILNYGVDKEAVI